MGDPKTKINKSPSIIAQNAETKNKPIIKVDGNMVAIFETLDIDGDGKLNFDDFTNAAFCQSEDLQKDIFRAMDKDEDGLIDLEEFSKAYTALSAVANPEYKMVVPSAPSYDLSRANSGIPHAFSEGLSNLEGKIVGNNVHENELAAWLRYIEEEYYTKYYPLFIRNGCETMEIMKSLTDKDLCALGIDKLGHRRKLLIELQKYRK